MPVLRTRTIFFISCVNPDSYSNLDYILFSLDWGPYSNLDHKSQNMYMFIFKGKITGLKPGINSGFKLLCANHNPHRFFINPALLLLDALCDQSHLNQKNGSDRRHPK